jgi:hypothetical protein
VRTSEGADVKTGVNAATDFEAMVRRNRRHGIATLGFVAVVLAVGALAGERPSWTLLGMATLIGLGQLLAPRLIRPGRSDPVASERDERRFEAMAVIVGVGLPLAALLAVAGLAITLLLQ